MKFPEKLWSIVNQCASGAVGWGMDGDRIFIDLDKFEMEYLGNNTGFKTKNIHSFIRQLNLYGFRKCSRYSDVHEFKHPDFIRGRKDLIKYVKRRLRNSRKYTHSDSADEMELYMDQQENKENIFSHCKKEPSRSRSIVQTSTSNIYWNQMQYYHSIYSDWLRRSAQFAIARGNASLTSSASVTGTDESTNVLPQKKTNSNFGNISNGNIVYVPVPAQYAWNYRVLSANMAMAANLGLPTNAVDGSNNTESSEE